MCLTSMPVESWVPSFWENITSITVDRRSARTYHEIIEGLVNLFVQILDKIHVRDAIDCPPESILLREVGKLTSNVRERAVMSC